jgi:phosphoribosylformylglycinamidine cyclo-ligase
LVRVIPDGFTATIERATWTPPAIFSLVQRLGNISEPDIEATLNMGVGMALVLPGSQVAAAQAALAPTGWSSWVCGSLSATPGTPATVNLVGTH